VEKPRPWLQIAADDWEELVVCFKKIEGQPLKTKAPTEKRFYDGAAMLKITFKDETYKSPSFDHGFPKY
jgi:hypothetical protein